MRKKSELRNYQLIGINHILNSDRGALFLDMGLGKTAITLTAFKDMLDNLEVKKALVIAPKRVAETVWGDEIKEWEHLKSLRIVNVSGNAQQRIKALNERADINTISIDNAVWLIGVKGGFSDYDMVIIDESSLLKNNNTQRFKTLRKATKDVPKIMLLTGTPTPNSLIELWTQLYIIDRGVRLYDTITKFRSVYTNLKFNGFGYEIKKEYSSIILDKIKDVCLSIRAKDYGMNQETILNIVKVKLDKAEMDRYEAFEKEAYMEFETKTLDVPAQIVGVNAAALLSKLLQFSNGAVYDSEKNVHVMHDKKLVALESIFNEVNTPVLVAYTFTCDKDRILKLALKMGKRAEFFTDSSQVARWNNRGIDVLIMHPKSGGHGLNLQKGGHTIVWFGATYSLENEQQLNARLARSGQTETVVIHKLITENTVEAEALSKLGAKERVQEYVLEHLKNKYK